MTKRLAVTFSEHHTARLEAAYGELAVHAGEAGVVLYNIPVAQPPDGDGVERCVVQLARPGPRMAIRVPWSILHITGRVSVTGVPEVS